MLATGAGSARSALASTPNTSSTACASSKRVKRRLGAPKSSAHGPEAESVAAAGVEGEGCERAGSARGAGAAQLASTGAVYASLPHLVDRPGRAAWRALWGGVVGSVTSLLVGALVPIPGALHLGLGVLVFAAMMTTAWGPRAGPISFTAILAIVFSLGAGHREPLPHAFLWTLAGAALYAVLAHVSTLLLEPFVRVAAACGSAKWATAGETLSAYAALLRDLPHCLRMQRVTK